MNIDTLNIGGGGIKGNIFIGCILALLNKNIIKKNYENIKILNCCSVGSIIGFFILCKLTPECMLKISKSLKYNLLINLDDLDNIFNKHGLFYNHKIINILKVILKIKFNIENITLIDLYKLTNIKFNCKVFNLSLKNIEYISYENHPNLSVFDLITMTTSFPLFFKPFKYLNNYYIDGGVKGDYFEPSETSIGLYIKTIDLKIEDSNLFEYIIIIMNSIYKDIPISKHNIIINNNNTKFALDFNVTSEYIFESLNKSYKITCKHIDKYKL